MKWWLCGLLVFTTLAPVPARVSARGAAQQPVPPTGQTAVRPASVAIHVRETGGIRRSAFPVTARVPLPRAALTDTAHARLLLTGTEVPVQLTATSRWPDGSLQWVDVDFNVSPGSGETVHYELEYGDGVSPMASSRGLSVVEDADGIQVGNVRFGRHAAPLVTSVKYRDEAIAPGRNGLILSGASRAHDLSSAPDLKVDVLKRGPLVVSVRYSGTLALEANAQAVVSLLVEMPSSKSWIKVSTVVDDPSRQVTALTFATPFALGAFPWVWDLGTSRWTYGQLRSATESMTFIEDRLPTATEWSVVAGPAGRQQILENSPPDHATFNRWAHLQGSKEVVALAFDGLTARTGSTRLGLSGNGEAYVLVSPPSPQTRHELVVYEHFVATPVQIGAATSPAAILSPPVAFCDRAQYVRSGVPVPPGLP